MASSIDDGLPPLLPEPWRAQRTPGCCVLPWDSPVSVLSVGDASEASELLASELRARGVSASTSTTEAASTSTSTSVSVTVTVAPGSTPSLLETPLGASEGYELEITPSSLSIRACSPAGAFYAVQTVRQLLLPKTKRKKKQDGEQQTPLPLSLPCLEVADAPRFAWRGLLLDVARHFFDARFVARLVDVAASLKLNVLHLHLVDDQGWRLPSCPTADERGEGEQRRGGENASFCDTYPLLSRVGAWRGDSRREAREWRAARRRSRRERRRDGEGGEGERGSDEGEAPGASPSSSEASSDGDGESDDDANSERASPDRRRRVRSGGFYSLRDLRKILEAAAARHVTVVPEADLPGHCGAAIACYPRLACGGDGGDGGDGGGTASADDENDDADAPPPPSTNAVPTLFGVHGHVLCASSEFSSSFARALLSDVAARLFPRSPFVHVGGDEVPRGPWEGCSGCRARSGELMARGVAGELRRRREGDGGDGDAGAAASAASLPPPPFCGDLLHSWFVSEAEETLREHGRRAVAWCDAFDARESARAAVASAVGERERGKERAGGPAPPRSASPSPRPPPSAVVMCWRGGGAPGARAAARGEDVVMCPASRCYLDYRNEDLPGEPGAWYASLTLRECWEFDPHVVDEAAEVEEGGGEGGEGEKSGDVDGKDEGEAGGRERDGGTPGAAAGATGEGVGEVGAASQRLRSASSSMADVVESQAPRASGDGDDDGDGAVSSHPLLPRPAPPSPPRDAPCGASLAMASSGGAATMSDGALGGGGGAAGEEEEVVGPANARTPPEKTRRRVVLRRVPLPESCRPRVLGGQACLWTEYCPDEATAEHLLFPRLLAIAEALWSRPLRERRGFAGGGEGGDEAATEGAWGDFVERARARASRLEGEGWKGRKF